MNGLLIHLMVVAQRRCDPDSSNSAGALPLGVHRHSCLSRRQRDADYGQCLRTRPDKQRQASVHHPLRAR